ncbi:methyltransferase domain-containing protein [Amycolatopsis cihanbeyliensis]|uniref:methyltransferase domain-containing protein n=1 Tax=Amycolatopsis cihanbeyliensis TaxID=1128664 RepID=UPI001150220B|nr:methyltransferase domain-containing protein [Amycolatopsis cihanbeyliensis]
MTQVNFGADPPDGELPWPSSSSSMPSIVAMMLEALDVRHGQSVLEIGTGTGWNAALLSRRAGDAGRVVTVEVDPTLAERARGALDRAGYSPTVVTGDGAKGFPDGAPYDRIIATASFREVLPAAWLEQLRPGGRLVGPWDNDWLGGMLVLDKDEDGNATGRFRDQLAFMRLRDQRAAYYGWEPEESEIERAALTETGCRGSDGDNIFNPELGRFAIGALVPDCYLHIDFNTPADYHHVVDLDDGFARSFARMYWDVNTPTHYQVRQLGPRKLWDEVEAAYDWWHDNDEPGMERFGLEIRDGKQWLWLDHPDHVVRVVTG